MPIHVSLFVLLISSSTDTSRASFWWKSKHVDSGASSQRELGGMCLHNAEQIQRVVFSTHHCSPDLLIVCFLQHARCIVTLFNCYDSSTDRNTSSQAFQSPRNKQGRKSAGLDRKFLNKVLDPLKGYTEKDKERKIQSPERFSDGDDDIVKEDNDDAGEDDQEALERTRTHRPSILALGKCRSESNREVANDVTDEAAVGAQSLASLEMREKLQDEANEGGNSKVAKAALKSSSLEEQQRELGIREEKKKCLSTSSPTVPNNKITPSKAGAATPSTAGTSKKDGVEGEKKPDAILLRTSSPTVNIKEKPKSAEFKQWRSKADGSPAQPRQQKADSSKTDQKSPSSGTGAKSSPFSKRRLKNIGKYQLGDEIGR